MTREERTYGLFAIMCLCATVWSAIVWTASAQPQPRLDFDPDKWAFVEFDNGAAWYIKESAINGVLAIPEDDARHLEYKTTIFFNGGKCNSPHTVKEIALRAKRLEATSLIKAIKELEDGEKNVDQ